jgi:uncharacterized protein (TIGR00255 family)
LAYFAAKFENMVKSMTGFGRVEQSINDKTFLIDIKSLNGKQFELNLRIPAVLKPFEFDIRSLLSELVMRGSVDCTISLKDSGSAKPVTINVDLAKAYFKPINELAQSLNLDTSSVMSALLKLPEVITPSADTLNGEEKKALVEAIRKAVDDLNDHRGDEGKALAKDMLQRIDAIGALQERVTVLDPGRKQKLKDGIVRLLEDNVGKENYDANRMEQELIYYIEKMDISEEQVRLKNHLSYFRQLLQENADAKGKKLSFLLQEIGREINTTGSKAYDSEIQKLVVEMKDELEKAKEQVLNVL